MTPISSSPRIATIILVTSILLSACRKTNSNLSGPGTYTPLNLPAGSTDVTTASNTFALNLFQKVLQTDTTTVNKLISPLSVYLALSMTYNGAAGTTLDSMAGTLGLTGVPTTELNSTSLALLQQLPREDSKVHLSLANSIWYAQSGPQPAAAFLNTARTDFIGAVQALDFNNPASVNTINSWVAKNTDNYIPTIIKALDPTEVMVLINAIYFNGAWLNAFPAANTNNQSFHLTGGGQESVPFMNETATIRASLGSKFTLAELPYGTGNAFDMYLAIPTDPSQPIDSFAASLDAGTIATAIAQLDSVRADLTIPKWSYSYSLDPMNDELTQMGMGIAFGGNADFSAMYPTAHVNLSKVIHKTYIQVSEEGTQAAAVTAVVGVTSIANPTTPITANHPFVYLIAERQTGTILFIGVLNDPAQN